MKLVSAKGAKGLLVSPRRVSQGEKGFFLRTNNVIVRNKDVIEPRFGTEAIGSTNADANTMFYDLKNGRVMRSSTTADLLEYWSGSAWTSLGSYRVNASLTARNFCYILTQDGLRKVNAAGTSTVNAVVPEGLDTQMALQGTSGWFPNATRVAYRVCFGTKTAENEFFLGAPSARIQRVNDSGGTRNITLTITVPQGMTTSFFYQVYRTDPSSGSSVDPGDTMYLVYENFLTSTEISTGLITYVDTVAVGNGGAALYTNPDQQTDTQGAFPCEAALSSSVGRGDLACFANCLWAANYRPRSSIDLALLGVMSETGLQVHTWTGDTTSGSPVITNLPPSMDGLVPGQHVVGPGIPADTYITIVNTGAGTITLDKNATATAAAISFTAGDVVTLAGVKYRGGLTEDISQNIFEISQNASASIAVQQTAWSFIRVVNRSASNTTVYGRSTDAVDGLPGHIRIFARTDRSSAYTIESTHGGAWAPNLTTANTILSKEEPSQITYSKPDEPEAWPPGNYIVLPQNAVAYAFASLRNALLVFTDRGLFRITGVYGNFSVDLVDESVRYAFAANNAGLGAVVADNLAYAFTQKGLVAANETGVAICSDPVSTFLQNTDPVNGRLSLHYGDGLIFVPITAGTLIYHTKYDLWTSFDTTYRCGVYDNTNRRLFLHSGSQSYRSRDAQYLGSTLYDGDVAVTVSSTTSTTVTLSAPVSSSVEVGDLFIQGSVSQTITAINGSVITLADTTGISASAATLRYGFTCTLLYCPIGQPAPSFNKHMRDLDVNFDGATNTPSSFSTLDNTTATRFVQAVVATDIDPTQRTQEKIVAFGDYAFPVRFYFPKESARCATAVLGVSWRNTAAATRLLGIDAYYEDVSERSRR